MYVVILMLVVMVIILVMVIRRNPQRAAPPAGQVFLHALTRAKGIDEAIRVQGLSPQLHPYLCQAQSTLYPTWLAHQLTPDELETLKVQDQNGELTNDRLEEVVKLVQTRKDSAG